MRIQHIDKYFNELVMHFKKQTLIPIFGAGFSSNESTLYGSVPSGDDYKTFMINEIVQAKKLSNKDKNELAQLPFSQICDVYEDNENTNENTRRKYIVQNFIDVNLCVEKKLLLSVKWPYVYTLNIDDSIEHNSKYNCVILPHREINNKIFEEKKCVIKLHGDANEILKFKDGYKVFSSKEYLYSLIENHVLLKKLQHDYIYQNIIFIGCSLNDEIDLKALNIFSENMSSNKTYSKIYYCTVEEPNFITKSKLKTYGVTDVIVFDNYTQIYQEIYKAGLEATKISEDELEEFHNFKIQQLDQKDSLNSKIFYNGLSSTKWNDKTIILPYFFIERELHKQLLNNIKKCTVHLILGNRISGKTFFLLNLIKNIKDRELYYFNANFKLNDTAFNLLLNKENALIIFDIGVLTKEQIEKVLFNSKTINSNYTNIVIALNNNDSDILGIIKWKLDENAIQESDFIKYQLNNTLSISETEQLNKLLPYCNFPAFKINHSILDNLSNAENIMKRKDGRFYNHHIQISNIYDLVFYIALATKNKLYSTDIVKFGLDIVAINKIQQHSPFIERVETVWAEKDGGYSPIKYVLNARYWLFRELGNFAENRSNYNLIIDAYKYIIRKQIESTGRIELEIRKNCKDYIMFDIINQIFLNAKNGQLFLCEQIYNALHEFLAGNYHYLHQYSKCCLKMCYSVSEKSKKIDYINKGLEKAKVAAAMVDAEYNKSNNENLLITQAHIHYTIATLASELCFVTQYTDISEIEYAVKFAMSALYSPYNKDEYLRDSKRSKCGIMRFLKSLMQYHRGKLNKETRRNVEALLSYCIKLN